MKILLVLSLLVLKVFAVDFHNIALKTFETSSMCGNESLLKVREEIKSMKLTDQFNSIALSGVTALVRYVDWTMLEIVFSSALTFLSDKQSPLCQYMEREQIDDYKSFLNSFFQSFERHPQLETFANYAYNGENGMRLNYQFENKQVEIARFFVVYSKHPISERLSFKFILDLFLYYHFEVYSCPELQLKLNTLFSSKQFKRKMEKIGSGKELLHELFFKHLFTNENLMFQVFNFILERRELDQELKFKYYFRAAMQHYTYNEFMGILFIHSLMNYQFDLPKIQQFIAPLMKSENEFDEFFGILIWKPTMKSLSGQSELKFDQFVASCDQYFFYISSIFENSDSYWIAENLVRHFRRVKYTAMQLPPSQTVGVVDTTDKFIVKIACTYGIDIHNIAHEFPLKMQKTQETNEGQQEFWIIQENLIKNTIWK